MESSELFATNMNSIIVFNFCIWSSCFQILLLKMLLWIGVCWKFKFQSERISWLDASKKIDMFVVEHLLLRVIT